MIHFDSSSLHTSVPSPAGTLPRIPVCINGIMRHPSLYCIPVYPTRRADMSSTAKLHSPCNTLGCTGNVLRSTALQTSDISSDGSIASRLDSSRILDDSSKKSPTHRQYAEGSISIRSSNPADCFPLSCQECIAHHRAMLPGHQQSIARMLF